MAQLMRVQPGFPCQPGMAHHPHQYICVDPDCGCDFLTGRPFQEMRCCIDGQTWPCKTKRDHLRERQGNE